ncbi:hypothetical protein DL96DRAFT_1687323 [Flagelloscypha sp. PMI_526]|nr:hypothetical protein DL96DRAFT_1687323 [Flagelloscypha sp. PMI_526]
MAQEPFPADDASSPPQPILQFVWPGGKKTKEKYAIAPLPATYEPVDWNPLVTGEHPIAVYEHVPPSEEDFTRGTLYLLLRRRFSGKTHWKTPYSFEHEGKLLVDDMTQVDRPLSYEDAMVVVKTSNGFFPGSPHTSAKDIGDQHLQFVE